MFFLTRSANFIFVVLIIGLFQGRLLGQCSNITGTGFIKSPVNGIKPNGNSVEVNKPFSIVAGDGLSSSTKLSIRYRIGFLNSTIFKASDFSCTGPCNTNQNVTIPNKNSFQIVQSQDLSIIFNEPGVYNIIQTYVGDNGVGYYDCMTIIVYPIPKFTHRVCGCTSVIVNIPLISENLFYDEIEINYTTANDKLKVKRADYGKEFNLIPKDSGPPDNNCSDRGEIKINGTLFTPFFTQGGNSVDLVIFTKPPGGGLGTTINYVRELICDKEGEFKLKFNSPVDELEVSKDGGSNWSVLPASSYLVVVSGTDFLIKGVLPPSNGDLCFRGNSKCGTIATPEDDRPKVCYTGEIGSIKDRFVKDYEDRVVEVTLKPKSTSTTSSIQVFRDFATPIQAIISSSSTNTYTDAKPTCGTLSYRTETDIFNENGSTTIIFSLPVTHKLSAATLIPIEGESVVSIKSTSYDIAGQVAVLSLSIDNDKKPGVNFNFYKSINGGAFKKINSSFIKDSFFFDSNSDPSVLNCYFVRSEDQCGYESPPSKTICTTVIKPNGNLIQWNKENVAVNSSNNYSEIKGYNPTLMQCSGGNCIEIPPLFPIISNETSFNMELADLEPANIHSVRIRLNVVLAGTEGKEIFSNIIEYFFIPKFYIPTIITPNGDSHNDELKIDGFHVKNLVFDIYDRWGAKIETLTNITQRWIPEPNLPEGEYFYKATATDYSPTPKQISKQGSILLVR